MMDTTVRNVFASTSKCPWIGPRACTLKPPENLELDDATVQLDGELGFFSTRFRDLTWRISEGHVGG